MGSDNSRTTEISNEIDNILPEDLTNVSSDTEIDFNGITFGHQVSGENLEEIVENSIGEQSDQLRNDYKIDIPPETEQMAAQLFSQFAVKQDFEGRVIELIAGACLYCACKVTKVPVNPSEVSDVGCELMDKKRLLRRTKKIAAETGLGPSVFFSTKQYVSRYCDELDANSGVEKRAKEIINICEDAGIAGGKSPSGWAASAIYNASLEIERELTQEEIAAVANVTPVTIRNRYKEQREVL